MKLTQFMLIILFFFTIKFISAQVPDKSSDINFESDKTVTDKKLKSNETEKMKREIEDLKNRIDDLEKNWIRGQVLN